MTIDGQFPKTRKLIARDEEIQLMYDLSQAVMRDRVCRVLYFQARGGLGKTRLLQDYPDVVNTQALHILVADIVDMYDFENRKPITIERKIVNSLGKAAELRGMKHLVDSAFLEYERAYDRFNAIRGFSHKATREAEKNIHAAFTACCNKLSKKVALVLRFDTFEAILNVKAPAFAFVFDRIRKSDDSIDAKDVSYNENVGVTIVLGWFNTIVSQLSSTLLIMAGRRVQNSRLDDVLRFKPVIRELNLLEEPQRISEYLQEYALDIPANDDRIPYIRKITGGLPLLLTLYARTRPDDADKPPRNSFEFEENLIEQTFNLLEEPPRMRDSDALPSKAYSFTVCLFILSCARRGIRRKELRGVFDWLGIQRDDQVIDRLEDETLIKTVRNWRSTNANDDKDDALLLLHDEVLILIDQSKKLDDLRYREPILVYLCRNSEDQVRARAPEEPPLKLLSDHMYYELTRDVMRGYRAYSVYVDWFLRQRFIQDALILADVFWSTLLYEVERGGEFETPFADKLAESLQVSIADIEREENVRYIKRLRYSDEDKEAAAWAEELYETLAAQGIVPPEQDWTKIGELPHPNTCIFADLCLTWVAALTKGGTERERLIARLTTLIHWLESDTARKLLKDEDHLPLHRHLAYLRRTFFLGEAYNYRGQLYDIQQFYARAVTDLGHAYDALYIYKTAEIPFYEDQPRSIAPRYAAAYYLNDDVSGDMAQIRNNLAYSMAKDGQLEDALKLSKKVIAEYIVDQPIASTYQQALFYNTNALIQIRRGNYQGAGVSLKSAKYAAEQSGVDRADGLVARAEALYDRARWNHGERIEQVELLEIDTLSFDQAVKKLQNEPSNLGEIFYERARFARDLALYFRSQEDPELETEYWNKADHYLDSATSELSKSTLLPMQEANLLETRACMRILRDDQDKDDEQAAAQLLEAADALLFDGKDMPSYADVVAGKVALQRGLLLLRQGDAQAALREMAVALARTYMFAPKHRDQAAFEKLISDWIRNGHIRIDDVRAFIGTMSLGGSAIQASELPYLPPPADLWLNEWERSLRFFQERLRSEEGLANAVVG